VLGLRRRWPIGRVCCSSCFVACEFTQADAILLGQRAEGEASSARPEPDTIGMSCIICLTKRHLTTLVRIRSCQGA